MWCSRWRSTERSWRSSLKAISNPEALLAQQNYVNSQPASQIGNRANPLNRPSPNAFNPNLGRLSTTDYGASDRDDHAANAVISADRRYVRITTLPFFSTIKGVVQYNLQTGVTDQAESDTAFQNLDINIDQDGGQNGGAVVVVVVVDKYCRFSIRTTQLPLSRPFPRILLLIQCSTRSFPGLGRLSTHWLSH